MKHLKIIIITAIIFIIGAAGLVYVSEPLYRSTFEIMIEKGLAYNVLRDDPKAFDEFINYQRELILSPGALEKTIKELHLDLSERFADKDIQKELRKYTDIEIVGNTLIKVSVYSDEPIFAIRLAQALADNYTAAISKEKYKISDDMKQWILETGKISGAISEKEKEIEEASGGEDVELIKRSAAAIEKNIERLQDKKEDLQKSIPKLQAEYEKVRLYEGISPQEAVEIINWPSFEELKREYLGIETQLQNLSAIYTDEHPDIVELKRKQQKIIAAIEQFLHASIKGKLITIEQLKKQIQSIDKDIARLQVERDAELQRTVKINIGEEELESLKKNYAELVEKLEEQGYFPIGATVLGLTPDDLTPAVEYKDYRQPVLIAGVLGAFVGLLISLFRKRKIHE